MECQQPEQQYWLCKHALNSEADLIHLPAKTPSLWLLIVNDIEIGYDTREGAMDDPIHRHLVGALIKIWFYIYP